MSDTQFASLMRELGVVKAEVQTMGKEVHQLTVDMNVIKNWNTIA